MAQTWQEAQQFESHWHGNCINSFWEETKQQVYASKMGLESEFVDGKFPVYNLNDKSILDIGGGAYSLLLKCINLSDKSIVIDPCDYPEWIFERYLEAGINLIKVKGEEFTVKPIIKYDECWIYNCLQHVEDPKKIIDNARQSARIIRIFEWIDNGVSDGHPQDLKENLLNEWLHGVGKVEVLNESGCNGKCYYGIFPTSNNEQK